MDPATISLKQWPLIFCLFADKAKVLYFGTMGCFVNYTDLMNTDSLLDIYRGTGAYSTYCTVPDRLWGGMSDPGAVGTQHREHVLSRRAAIAPSTSWQTHIW
jgi:hypothetical protein